MTWRGFARYLEAWAFCRVEWSKPKGVNRKFEIRRQDDGYYYVVECA